jgi:hypothetical protein
MLGLMAIAPTGGHAERVAVGRGFGDQIEPDGEGSARLVLDHDRLPDDRRKLSDDQARERIGSAARRLRHDQPDRLVGVLRLRRGLARNHHAGYQQRRKGSHPSRTPAHASSPCAYP